MNELQRRGHKATLVAPNTDTENQLETSPQVLPESGLKVLRVPRASVTYGLLGKMFDQAIVSIGTVARILPLALGREKPDIVFATVPAIPTAFAGYVASFILRTPLVIDLRDAWPDLLNEFAQWEPEEKANNKHNSHVLKLMILLLATLGGRALSAVLRRAELVVTTSSYLASSLRSRTSSKIITIRNSSISGQRYQASRLAREPGSLRVLYAGTIGRAQGLDNSLRALRICRNLGLDVRLRFVGSGADLSRISGLVSTWALPVELLPPVPVSRMGEHYDWCDTILVHLRDWEPLERTVPSKLYEAIGLGIPISIAANGESAEIVSELKCGIAVPAMNPEALAGLWQEWTINGVPELDTKRAKRWLMQNADPQMTSAQLVETLESLVSSHTS